MKLCKLCYSLWMIIFSILFFVSFSQGADLYSDTWVATDALGRQLPGYEECGPPKKNKYVGIFYFLWFGHHGTDRLYDITKILAENPKDPNWGPVDAWHLWGESENGYYLTMDPYVLRKHASMLSDAGVDVIIFDTTNYAIGNDFTYKNEYLQLCKIFSQVRSEGGATPQIAFLCPFFNVRDNTNGAVQDLYKNLYSIGLYRDLFFYWDGKPLILADPNLVSGDARTFFTFRKGIPSCFTGPSEPNQWGWLEDYPQHVFYDSANNAEEVTVGVAQNLRNGAIAPMSYPQGVQGRSWHNKAKESGTGAVNYGYNFAEQWQRALQLNPEFIFITGWNEWMAVHYETWSEFSGFDIFVDTYNQEYSRDIEPMKGGHTDNYYYQMISNIRKFKGVNKAAIPSPAKTIVINGNFSDWNDVEPELRDTIGDTAHRDYAGWGNYHYTNNTGRNDIIRSKVTYDANNIYFYVETKDPLTSYTNSNWMLLFIDSDQNISTGWQGYDYLVNSPVNSPANTTIKHYTGDGNWKYLTDASYVISINKIEMAIPRAVIGQGNGQSKISFDFHWADNIQKLNDITEFFVSGDSAPNRRFNYRYEVVPTDNLMTNRNIPAETKR